MGYRRTLFRIAYRSVYVLLYVVLVALLLVTPADCIQRSLNNSQNYKIWLITICYVSTIVIVIFIYALRLYINKTAVDAIPRPWIPLEKQDVKKRVYKMVQAGLNKSAWIAYEAHPRVRTREEMQQSPTQTSEAQRTRGHGGGLSRVSTMPEGFSLVLPPHFAPWGKIEHPGWASPNSPDLPNLEYNTVLSELPNLIEAKALTLAPSNPTIESDVPVLDAETVALLRRAPNMHLRAYMDHLGEFGMLDHSSTVTEFLSEYEVARFSTRAIPLARFQELMALFAEILRSMKPLDPNTLDQFDGNDDGYSLSPSESDIDNDAPMRTNPSSPLSPLSRSTTVSTRNSRRRPARKSSTNTWNEYLTAPSSPSKGKRAERYSMASSEDSFAQTRRRFPSHQPSTTSLRSHTSASTKSVIRLATEQDSDGLPFVLTLNTTSNS